MNKRLSDRPGIGAPSIGRAYAVWPTFGFMTAIWMALTLYTNERVLTPQVLAHLARQGDGMAMPAIEKPRTE